MNSKNYTIIFVFCISLLVCISAVSGAGVDNSSSATSTVSTSDTTPSNDADTTIIEKTSNDKKTVKTKLDTSKKEESIKKNSKENSTINSKTNLNNKIKQETTLEKNSKKINSNIKSSKINNTLKQEFKNKTTPSSMEVSNNNISTAPKQVKSIKTYDHMEISTEDVTAEYGTDFILPVYLNPETDDGGVMLYVNREPMVDEINLTLDPHYFTVPGDKYCPGNYSFWLSFLASDQYDPASDTSHYFTVYGDSSIVADETTIEVDKRNFEAKQIGLTVTADGEDATEYPLYTTDGTVAFYIDGELVSNSSYEDDYKIDITEDMIKNLAIGEHTWKAVYAYSNEYLRNSSVSGTLNIKGAKDNVQLSTNSEYTTNVNGVVSIPVTFNTTVNEGELTVSYGGSIDDTVDLSTSNPTLTFDTTGYLPGEYNLVINYTGSSNFNSNSTTTTLKIYQPTSITPDQTTIDFEVGKGNTQDIEFTMQTDANGDVITGSIDIYLGDDIIDSINVDSETATFTLDDDILRGYAQGTYDLKAVFVTGDEYYPKSNTTITLNTYGDVIIDMTPITVDITNTFKVPLTVTYNEEELTTGTLKYYIDDNPVKTIDLSTTSVDDVVLDTTGLSIGEHTLKVTYDSDVYTATQNHTTLTVKSPVTITIDTPNTNINLTTLEITTTDYYKALINTDLEITLPNGTIIKTKTVNGKISVDVPELNVGENKFTIKSIADDTYNEATVYLTVDVVKLNTTITTTVKKNIYQNTTITVTVNDANTTNTVKDGTVTVTENGKTITTGTITNGKVDIDLNTLSVGTHTLTLNYGGNDNYNTSTTTFDLEVVGRLSKIETTIKNTTVGNISVEVLLTDPVTSEVIPNAPITITLPDGTIKSATTGTNGIATFNDIDLTVGEKTITVNFAGNDNYNKTNDQKTFTVTKRESNIDATITNYVAGKVTVQATVTDKTTGNAVKEGTVVITENGIEVGRGTVNTNAIATIKTDITTMGDHTLLVTYLESTNYTSSSTTLNNIKVVGKESKVNVEIKNSTVGNTTINIEVVDKETGGALSNANVNITLPDGTNITKTTDNEGKISDLVLDLPVGTNNINVTYLGDDTYNSSYQEVSINVEQRESTITEAKVTNNTAGKVTVEVTVTDTTTGKPVTDGTVKIYEGNEKIGTATIDPTTGKATIETDIITKGDHNLVIKYEDATNYTDATKTLDNVNVVGKKSQVDVTVTDDVLGETKVKITVTDSETSNPIPNANVEITLPNGTKVTGKTGEDGTVELDTELPVGSNTITVTYVGNDTYNSSTTPETFTVKQRESTILAGITNNTVGKVTIQGVVTDKYTGKIITSGTVTVKDTNDNVVGTGSIGTDGKVTIVTDIATKGEYNLVVTYNGNENYTESSTTLNNVNIVGKETKVTANITDDTVGKTVIEINVTDPETGNPIPNAEVNVTLPDGTNKTVTTNNDGNANLTVDIPAGSNIINITYLGDDEHESSNTTITTSVDKIKTNVVTYAVTTNIGNTITLKATVKDADGNLITGGKVAFKINDKTLKDDEGNILFGAVNNGAATITYTIPSDYVSKTYKLSAVYSGDSTYDESRSEAEKLTLKKRTAQLTIISNTTTTKVDETIKLTVNVKDGDNTVNGYVIFKVDGKTLTDDKGNEIQVALNGNTATYEYTLPHSMAARTHTFSAVLGNNSYNRVQANTKVTVQKTTTTTSLKTVKTSTNTAVLTGTLKDEYKHNLVGTNKVALKLNDVTLKDANNKTQYYYVKDGNVNINFTLPSFLRKGTYKLTLTTGDRYTYTSSKGSTTLTITDDKNFKNIKTYAYKKYVNIYADNTVNNVNTTSSVKLNITDNKKQKINTGTIQFKLNNKIIATNTVNNGVCTFNYKFTTIGTYNIIAYYVENNNYYAAMQKFTVKIIDPRQKVVINICEANHYVNKTTTITATIKDTHGNAITTGKALIKINDKEVIRKDIKNGIIDYSQTFKSLGKYNITVTYLANSEYYSNSKSSSFTVTKSVPVITLKPTSTVKGIDTDITVSVKDTEGNVVNKGIITLYIDNKQVLKQDISKQVAVYNIKYNRTLKHIIKAVYNEDTEYTQSTKNITLNVYANKNLYLKTSNINVEKNHEAEIITTVTDNKNTVVNTGKITIKINKKTLKNTAGNIVFSNVLGSKSIITHTFNLPAKKYTMQSIYADENIVLRKNSTLIIN